MELPIIMKSETFNNVQAKKFPCATGVGVPYFKGFCIIAGNISNVRPEVIKTGLEYETFKEISIDDMPLEVRSNFEKRGLLKTDEIPEGHLLCACGCGKDFMPKNNLQKYYDSDCRKKGSRKWLPSL